MKDVDVAAREVRAVRLELYEHDDVSSELSER